MKSFTSSFKELYDRDFRDCLERSIMLFSTVAAYLGDHLTVERG